MLYLLDANVLIDAGRDYYPIERVPEFWAWLAHMGGSGSIKVPLEIYDEVKEGRDSTAAWIKRPAIKAALLLDEEVDTEVVTDVVARGYAPNLTDAETIAVGKDPFLLAYAARELGLRCIVTTEVSKPSRQRANRHLPDVARSLGMRSCNTFDLIRALNFTTNWSPG